jgi:hypothetical protein
MGNILVDKYCPYRYIYSMITENSTFKAAVARLKNIFEQAGYITDTPDFKESSVLLWVPGLKRTFNVRWKQYLGEAEIVFLQHAAVPAEKITTIAVTKYLSIGLLERCKNIGLSVLDENGNGYIKVPGFSFERYIEPLRKGRLKISGTPFSMKASRLIRAFLADPGVKWSQRELVIATGITQGYSSVKLKQLLDAGYLIKAGDKFRVADIERLLDDWVSHYRFDRHGQYRFAFSAGSYEEGLIHLSDGLKRTGIEYAFTGWSGAFLKEPYVILQKWMAFVEKIPDIPESIGLYPVDQSENVLLVVPQDRGVFQFTQQIQDMIVAAGPQIYIDLVRLPGRAKEAAQAFRQKYLDEILRGKA